jgi:dimethylamine monooxygenase subunit A
MALPTQSICAYKMKKSNKPDRQIPPHFPFEDPPFRLSMGLLKIPESEWFEIFDLQERALQMTEKRKLLANNQDEVFISDPSAMMASTEVLNLMLEHLPIIRPELYSRQENTIKLESHTKFDGDEWSTDLKTNEMHPLDLAARLVQEDLIIMLPPDNRQTQTSKGWWLAAGSVAFPSRWSLKKKFRQTMDIIHAPVPFYKEQLQPPTNNFFDQMPVNEIFSRRNWSLHDNPFLRQDGTERMSEEPPNRITSVNAGEHLWLRVERQTLRKLKETGAILFTIRIHLRQLKHVVKFQGIPNRIARALSALPPEMQTYKQTDTFADSVQNYLNQF